MPQPEHFDVLVFGSGTAGKLIAWHMARQGQRTAAVERQWIGGACPNIACMPSKNEIRSAEVAHLARHAAEFGTMTELGRGRYGDGAAPQARDGRTPGRQAPGTLPNERSPIDHGQRSLCRAESS